MPDYIRPIYLFQCAMMSDEHISTSSMCRHWNATGKCVYEDTCKFIHTPNMLPPTTVEKQRTQKQRRVVRNEGRASAFRRWLLRVFGSEYLNSGSGIVDVAGGKGELSFELRNINGIQSTVFDPRSLDISYYSRKFSSGFYHRNAALSVYNTKCSSTDTDGNFGEIHVPQHICGYFEMQETISQVCRVCKPTIKCKEPVDVETIGVETDHPLSEDDYHFPAVLQTRDNYNAAQHAKVSDTGEQEDGEVVLLEKAKNVVEDISQRDLTFEQARQVLRHCSIIVGMHPDQAAEHIVDFALLNRKPFAIVPCCVHGKLFPRRFSGDGRLVRKYADLVEYLLSKHVGIQAVELDFEGRNVLLYYIPAADEGHTARDREERDAQQVSVLVDPAEPQLKVVRGPATQELWRSIL